MTRKRKELPFKKKAILLREVASTCPFCRNQDSEHFQFHHIDENPENDGTVNLLAVCPTCHSKITKKDISKAEVMFLKSALVRKTANEKAAAGKVITFPSKVQNAVVGNYNRVTFNVRNESAKKVKNKYPEGCVGADIIKANYIGYLINQYQDYKKHEMGDEMNYAIFQAHLKKQFKIGASRSIYNVPISRFEEMAAYIQSRMDQTRLAKINRSKLQFKNYRSYEEYAETQS